MRSRLIHSLVFAFVLCLIFSPTISLACGPFTLEAVFVFTVHPAYPLDRFAGGHIGVVQPSYARSYLYVAYKYLEGGSFTPREQRMLTELWKERLDYGWSLGEDEWIKSWLAARKKVPGLSEPPALRVYRNREEPNRYETYLNCQKDSFDAAITTLNERASKFGTDSSAIKDWVTAQDQVFSNCSEGRQIPSPSTDATDPLIRADREYQIAAANFYSTNFDEATRRFDAIAADQNSPWRTIAPYLAARSLVRKASLSAGENKSEPLSQAETRLRKILVDAKLASSHVAAARLLDLVRLRLNPSDRLLELAKKLVVQRNGPSLKQDLWDYTSLLDSFLETDEAEKANFGTRARSDDLTDWIYTIQSPSPTALEHSLSRWRADGSIAWLIASLSKIQATHPTASELTVEASKVKSDSAAFPSARFHAVRLLIESGKHDAARSLVDELLKNHRDQFDKSSLNLLLSQRMSLATSLADLLTFAPRLPATLSWNDDGRELPGDEAVDNSPEVKASQGKAFFDIDAVQALNRHLPLSLLKDAARSSSLPVNLRRDLAQAVWLRAVLLDDLKTADELVPTLRLLVPQLSTPLNEFVAADQPAAKNFSAIYTWLKFPGLEPVVDQGIGREVELNIRDTYRDNWWCSAAVSSYPEPTGEGDAAPSYTAKDNKPPTFLSAAQTAVAAREHSAIKALGAGPNYIARQVIAWANRNPTDQRVPEALHLAIYSSRYGCTDKDSGRWSKAAFDLLHRRYPNTTWAKKTKYWFKD
jgi:hypothetical protein